MDWTLSKNISFKELFFTVNSNCYSIIIYYVQRDSYNRCYKFFKMNKLLKIELFFILTIRIDNMFVNRVQGFGLNYSLLHILKMSKNTAVIQSRCFMYLRLI